MNSTTNNSKNDHFDGRVVVGMDGSESAMRAAKWGAREARLRGRGLTLAHAVLPTVIDGGFGLGIPPRLDLIDELRRVATTELTDIAAHLNCPDVDIHVGVSSPSGLLLTASETASMIVLGSRGHGGFHDLLLGSVCNQVSAHADCPVIVIRDEPHDDAHEIVVGIDGSEHSIAALDFAFDEASRHGWEIVAVHAWDVPSYDLFISSEAPIPIPLENIGDAEVRLASEVLSGYAEDYPDVQISERLVRSSPVLAILDATTDAALVVLGTRGLNAALGALLGSVSNAVLHKAHVPVAIVPIASHPLDAA
jgi:nucleotide-binding universal stress UspA family protein